MPIFIPQILEPALVPKNGVPELTFLAISSDMLYFRILSRSKNEFPPPIKIPSHELIPSVGLS